MCLSMTPKWALNHGGHTEANCYFRGKHRTTPTWVFWLDEDVEIIVYMAK